MNFICWTDVNKMRIVRTTKKQAMFYLVWPDKREISKNVRSLLSIDLVTKNIFSANDVYVLQFVKKVFYYCVSKMKFNWKHSRWIMYLGQRCCWMEAFVIAILSKAFQALTPYLNDCLLYACLSNFRMQTKKGDTIIVLWGNIVIRQRNRKR